MKRARGSASCPGARSFDKHLGGSKEKANIVETAARKSRPSKCHWKIQQWNPSDATVFRFFVEIFLDFRYIILKRCPLKVMENARNRARSCPICPIELASPCAFSYTFVFYWIDFFHRFCCEWDDSDVLVAMCICNLLILDLTSDIQWLIFFKEALNVALLDP